MLQEIALQLPKSFVAGYCSAFVATFGENLKGLRRARRLKGNELAAMVSVPPSTISQWEIEPGLPGTKTLLKLAKALKCSVEELIRGIDPEYDEVQRDLIRQMVDQKSPLPERGADVPASGALDRSLLQRIERLESELNETRDVANRATRLLEQSGVPAKARPTAQPSAGVRRRDRKTG